MNRDADILVPVETPERWRAYHDMRRRILWEARGKSDYQEDHPDEHKPCNHPMLLLSRGEPIGVVRIDLDQRNGQATMRRVAIAESEQRRGHGRTLIRLVEDFALRHGCPRVVVASAGDATGFYEKCGYSAVSPNSKHMLKELTERNC
jgi:N-acetylglutamate synthase-like GNAT family acetyltransferase